MERSELLELGIAVYRVGDVYDTDQAGMPIPASDKEKWFVSVLADSHLAAPVSSISYADTEDEAWTLAAERFGK